MSLYRLVKPLTLSTLLALGALGCTRADRVPQSDSACAITPAPNGAWAQERVGADLAREWIDSLPAGSTQAVQFSMFEAVDLQSFSPEVLAPDLRTRREANNEAVRSSHGTYVAQLIAGDAPVGGSSRAILGALGTHSRDDRFTDLVATENVAEVVPLLLERDIHVLNMSHGLSSGFSDDLAAYEADPYNIIVQSSGNHFPEYSIVVPRDSFIGVGNASALGLIAQSSSSGNTVDVLAPSDNSLLSRDRNGEHRFAGTSGAAPQVTAAVINVLSLIPRTTASQMRALLRKTAIVLPATRHPERQNGAGLLNAYKLVRVAQRLKAAGWPRNSERLMRDSSLFDFSDEAGQLLRSSGAGDPCALKHELKALRIAFLLRPDHVETQRRLAQVYRALGDPVSATYYELFEGFGIQKILSLKSSGWDADVVDDVDRAVASFPLASLTEFAKEQVLASNSESLGSLLTSLRLGAGNRHHEKTERLLRALASEPDVLQRMFPLVLSPGGRVDPVSSHLNLHWVQLARACGQTRYRDVYEACLVGFEGQAEVPGAYSVRECVSRFLLSLAQPGGARYRERVIDLSARLIRMVPPNERISVLHTFRQGVDELFRPGPASSAREELLRRF